MSLPAKYREKALEAGLADYNVCIVLGCKNKRQIKGGRQNFNVLQGLQKRYQMCEKHRDARNKKGIVLKLKSSTPKEID